LAPALFDTGLPSAMTLDGLKGMPMVSYGFDGGALLSRIYSDYLESIPISAESVVRIAFHALKDRGFPEKISEFRIELEQ
jgi:hypothetical protein